MKTIIKSFLLALFFATQILPQEYLEKQFKGYTSPDELITLSANVSFNQAVALLSKVSESVSGKRIVSTVESEEPIGIVLVQYAGLTMKKRRCNHKKKRDNYRTLT
jgi:hypothetical protein